MRFSDTSGHKIVSMSTAETVGKLDEFVVDPRTHSVLALRVKKTASGDTLRWADISAFGSDAVTVSGAERITDADDAITALSGKDHQLLGKRVLSTLGDELGKVADVEFDPESAIITAIALDNGRVEGVRLVGVGSYAVVVHAE